MNLSRRFFILNTLAIVFTFLLTSLAVVIFIAFYAAFYSSEASMSDMKKAIEVRIGFGEIKKKLVGINAEEALDARFQNTLSAEVKALGADVAIIKNRDLIYSTRDLKKIDVEKCLSISHNASDKQTLEINDQTFIFDRVDLKVLNGNDIVIMLLAPVKLRMDLYKSLAVFAISVFVLSFLGMNLWVSLTLNGSFISPVSRLNMAASKISEGDLNCEIAEEGYGEVRQLCRTLEQMRIKFKESVYMQEKYDENRKFLISSISHDLKTPVTSIKGYIEGILDGVAKTPEKINDYLETARSKTILVNSMIDDLLLYSKLDLNQIPFNLEKTEVLNYFEYCILDCKYEFEKLGMEISLKNKLKGDVFVLIDKERLRRVIQNILDNSKKYMLKDYGRVDILLRETHTSAIIEIRDNGKGIPEKDVPFVFDRFYRGDTSRRNSDGSGLGLAIAKQIVEGHEGRIWAISTEGVGTSIIISLKKC